MVTPGLRVWCAFARQELATGVWCVPVVWYRLCRPVCPERAHERTCYAVRYYTGCHTVGLQHALPSPTPDTLARQFTRNPSCHRLPYEKPPETAPAAADPAGVVFPPQFLNDHVHPNNLGKQLFADMLSYAVLDARAELLDMERRGVEVAPLGLPARPMMEGGDTVVLKQCYMSLKSSMAHEMDLDAVPRDYLPIVSSDGWKFVMYDGPRLVGTYKPGASSSNELAWKCFRCTVEVLSLYATSVPCVL